MCNAVIHSCNMYGHKTKASIRVQLFYRDNLLNRDIAYVEGFYYDLPTVYLEGSTEEPVLENFTFKLSSGSTLNSLVISDNYGWFTKYKCVKIDNVWYDFDKQGDRLLFLNDLSVILKMKRLLTE